MGHSLGCRCYGQRLNVSVKLSRICPVLLLFFRREESDVKHALSYNQRQLKELKDSKTDRLKRFGPNVPALLEAIDDAYRQGLFTYKPVGPLGICLNLVRL